MPEEEEEQEEQEVVQEPITNETELIFETTLAMNGQATIKKTIRDRLNLEPGVVMWLKVLRVVSPQGKTIYESKDTL